MTQKMMKKVNKHSNAFKKIILNLINMKVLK